MRFIPRPLRLSVVLIALPAVAWAMPVHLGARLGLSLSNIHGEFADFVSPDNKLGFQGGGMIEIPAGPIGVALELNYVQRGFVTTQQEADDTGNPTGTIDSRLNLSYLEVPVLVRAPLPLGGAWQPYAVLGPSFGFALAATAETDAPGYADLDLSDDMKPVDMGATAGLGVYIGRGPVRLAVETRYFTGFSDLWDISGNIESINHGFGFTVGVVR